jgi:hypothetical protein
MEPVSEKTPHCMTLVPEAADWTEMKSEIAKAEMVAAVNEEQEKNTEMMISGTTPPMTL